MYKKIFSALLLCAFFATAGYAQTELELPAEVAKTVSLSQKQLEWLLARRVQKSYANAVDALQEYPLAAELVDDMPYLAAYPSINLAEELYPEMQHILTTPAQWNLYATASQNRHNTAQLYRTERFIQNYYEQFPQMYRHEQVLNVPPDQYIKTLAEQIPANTKYLLLGEMHKKRLLPHIAELISRLADSERQIILFTEFLPHSAHTKNTARREELLREYWPVWKAAKQANIPIAGLEPEFAVQNEFLYLVNPVTKTAIPFWRTIEGMRLRNQHWLKLINLYREEFPDALFIIYAGGGHIAADRPYSLGKSLAGPDTFTALILSTEALTDPLWLANVSSYDTFCAERNIPLKPFIKFDYPISKRVGFNARIFIEP